MTHATWVQLSEIRIDGGTQSRVSLDKTVVSDYSENIDSLPPVVVFFDGSEYWLADGFHRFHAHRKAGVKKILADGRTGSRRDAVLYSVGANSDHGLRRSNTDKRRSVQTLLEDAEWNAWSDRHIAAQCGVSVPFVGAIRRPEVKKRQKAARAESAAKSAGCNPITPESITSKPAVSKECSPTTPAICNPITDKPADSEPVKPARPDKNTPTIESLQAEIESLREQISVLRDNNRELGALLESYDAVTAGEHESAKEMARLLGAIRTAEVMRDQYMTTCGELRKEVKAMQAKIKRGAK